MAKMAPILANLSGSIGGDTFSRNRGGPYVKRRSVPTNPTSTRQTETRSALATLSSSWAAQSDADQASWNTWAAAVPLVDTLGNSINLTGQQAWVMLGSRVVDSGVSLSTWIALGVPTGSGPLPPTGVDVQMVIGHDFKVVYTNTPLGAGEKLVVWTTEAASRSLGANPNINQARLASYSALAAASPLNVDLPAPLLTGQAINVYVAVMDQWGRLSPFTKVRYVAP